MSIPGRPETLTDQMKHDICLAVSLGCSQRRAAEFVGIDESTVRKAADRDPQFGAELTRAAVKLEMDCLDRIRQGKRSWRSSAWLLDYLHRGQNPRLRLDPHKQRLLELLEKLPPHPDFDDSDFLPGPSQPSDLPNFPNPPAPAPAPET
jgi:hypothetical protein